MTIRQSTLTVYSLLLFLIPEVSFGFPGVHLPVEGVCSPVFRFLHLRPHNQLNTPPQSCSHAMRIVTEPADPARASKLSNNFLAVLSGNRAVTTTKQAEHFIDGIWSFYYLITNPDGP